MLKVLKVLKVLKETQFKVLKELIIFLVHQDLQVLKDLQEVLVHLVL